MGESATTFFLTKNLLHKDIEAKLNLGQNMGDYIGIPGSGEVNKGRLGSQTFIEIERKTLLYNQRERGRFFYSKYLLHKNIRAG